MTYGTSPIMKVLDKIILLRRITEYQDAYHRRQVDIMRERYEKYIREAQDPGEG
jgi:hypothetical protein